MATQASPGLNAPSAYDPVQGIPPNMSTLAAMSAGIVPTNIQPVIPIGLAPRAVLEAMSSGGAQGRGIASVNTGQDSAISDSFNNAANGGGGLGAGGMNQDLGSSSGSLSQLLASRRASNSQYAAPQGFQG
jgi:hypothetical protein